LQALAAESILQDRTLRWTSDVGMLFGLGLLCLLMVISWRRVSPGLRVLILITAGAAIEFLAVLAQARWPLVIDTSLFHIAILAYLAAVALDE
ncbi:hypothetical protein ACSTLC_24275, partial [Vibrio parahaemolyticus]